MVTGIPQQALIRNSRGSDNRLEAPLVNARSFWNQSTAALTQALGSGTAGLVTDEANRRLFSLRPE